ncbi:MAG: amino acid adenylation domain-containing protein [Candidatus Aminicenantes bacterium]|jgi:amino acid adenylation domain-containing protein
MKEFKKLDKENIEDIIALAPTQEGILFHYLKDPESDLYFEQLSLNISGEIAIPFFERAWNFVIQSNEMLRTVYHWENVKAPLQFVLKRFNLKPTYINLPDCESREKEKLLQKIKITDKKNKFDLREVSFRVTLCKISEMEYEMIISNHHILYDGWSNSIILGEFLDAYNNLLMGNPLKPQLKTKFKEFVKWLRVQDTITQDESWKEYFSGFKARGKHPVKRYKRIEIIETGNHHIKLHSEMKNKLEAFVRSRNITMASLLYSAWGLLLQYYNFTNDVLFDITVSGRTAKIRKIENMVGLFINTLPVRVQSKPGEKISHLLSRMHHMLQSIEKCSPLRINEYLQECLHQNLFDSVVVLENYPLARILVQENRPLTINYFEISGMTPYDLTVIITLFDDIEFAITYDKHLFEEAVISSLGDGLISIVEEMVNNPGKSVGEIKVLSDEARKELVEQIRAGQEVEQAMEVDYTAPVDKVEEKLVDIWSGLFRVDKADISIDTDFFAFGGHSLKATLLIARIHKELQVKVPLVEIFRRSTIRELAKYIREAAVERYTAIEFAEEKEYYAVSSSQQRMYALHRMEPESIAYNVSDVIMVEGRLEKAHVDIFETSFKKLLNRHESLRTSFDLINGEPVQIIHKTADFFIKYMDIKARYQQDETAADHIIHSFIKPFRLKEQPLIRIAVVKLAEEKHLLLFDTHHIISDGSSMNIFIKEFITFYSGENLPSPGIQYKDFSIWQQKQLRTEAIKQQEAYWLNTFSGEIPVLNLHPDFPGLPDRTGRYEGDKLYFRVNQAAREKIRPLEKTSGATLYMILLAAYNVLLMKYSGQEDIVVGTLTDGRPHADLENIIGVMITTLAMRNQPNRRKRFIDFLKEVKTNSLNAFENSDYQFEELLKNIRLNREVSRNPLFNTMFLLQNYEWTELAMEGLVFKPYPFKTNASTFDLRVTVMEVKNTIDIEIQYASKLFKETTIHQLAHHYINILEQVGNDPQKRLADIQILTEKEKKQVLCEFNKSQKDVGQKKTVYQLFENQVEKTPDRTALRKQTIHVSYNQLNERSNRLARFLRKKDTKTGQPVGILLPPSIELVVTIFATWKAGGAYIPIDPKYPVQRITGILEDSGARVILSQTGTFDVNVGSELEKAQEGKMVRLDQQEAAIARESAENPDLAPDLNSPVYIIYTSGSTGKPKGAGVYQRGFFNLMTWFVMEFELNADDSNLLITSLSFDLTQKNIFAPLVTGGTLTLPGFDYFDPDAILKTIWEKKITWLNCTPSMIYKIIEFSGAHDIKKLASLRYLFLGGEPIAMVMLKKWIESAYFNTEIVNTYGPTECTDICASYRLAQPETFYEKAIPIGKPIYNVRLYILDQSFQPLPVGVPGELFIGGEGVGIGYINDVSLTSKKFITIFLQANPGARLYQTGDLVKWLPGGNIEFIGRIDHQVKIRGFRIELGEIETQLLKHDKIKGAVVLPLERNPHPVAEAASDKYLCAYIEADKHLTVYQLREYLSGELPDYMIPSYFMQLEKIPLTPNGKVDRNLLPKPGRVIIRGIGVDYAAPTSEIEKKLVRIWQGIFGEKRIGIEDNFFELGGDSLLAIQCIARIREELQVEFPLKLFFEQPFIKAFSKRIAHMEAEVMHIKPAPRDGKIPLSFSQERLWFLQHLDNNNMAYHVPRAIRIKGKLAVNLLERTFTDMIKRHEILRTSFPTIDGEPVQHIRAPFEFKIPQIDLSYLEGEEQSNKISELIAKEGQQGFDFEKGPMLRAVLLKLKEVEHLLILTEHHLIHDGWTQGVLLKEFISIFSAYWEGKTPQLPPMPIQYADYAIWQRNSLQGKVLEQHLDYWKEKLAGLAPLFELPTDRPRPHGMRGNGAVKTFFLSKELSDTLKKFSKEKDVTLFMTMLAAFKVFLYRYTGTEDLCVGTGMANRRYKELEGMLGMLINTLALRTQISGELSFEDCLQRVKTTCLEAYEHENTPFEKVVEVLQPKRSLSYTPIIQVVYSFMDTPAGRLQLPGLELNVEEAHNRSSKFDFNIIVEPPSQQRMEETGGRIEIVWEYNTDLFNDETIDMMLKHYNGILEQVVENAHIKLKDIEICHDFLVAKVNILKDDQSGFVF